MITSAIYLWLYVYFVNALPNISFVNVGPEKLTLSADQHDILFEEFVETYDKKYTNEDQYNFRRQIFLQNLREINEYNGKSDSEVYGVSEFTDMTSGEFNRKLTGLRSGQFQADNMTLETYVMQNIKVPAHWDWRTKGAVTPPRNQGPCGSCWIFAAIGVVESQYAIKHRRLVLLSDQQMVDCFPTGGCGGGGLPHYSFREAAMMGGFMGAADYQYTAQQERCKFNPNKVYVTIQEGHRLHLTSEEQLMELIYTYGPVAAGLYGTKALSFYKGGIATSKTLKCKLKANVNHCGVVVGYGTENGIPYWIIKNSFGPNWGERGYLRLERGNNSCSILNYAAVVEID